MKNFLNFLKKVLAFSFFMCYYMQALERVRYALVAQLDRVTDYESVGRGFESLPAYQKSRYPFGYLLFCYAERLDSKGRPCQRQGKKVSRGHFLSPWESPWIVGCIRRIVDHYPFLFGYLLFCFYGGKGLEGLDPSCRWQLGRCRLDGIGTLQFCNAKLGESLPAYAALSAARERIATSLCSSQ